MPKFTVTLREVAYYDIIVDADNAEQAEEAAEEVFVQSSDILSFFTHCEDREAWNVEPLSDEMAARIAE